MSWAEQTGRHVQSGGWTRWIFLSVGPLSVVAGIVVLVEPSISLRTLAVVTGIFLVVDGVIELISSLFEAGEGGGFRVFVAIVSVIGGVILIRHPFVGVVAIALLLGLWLIASGAFRLAWTIGERRARGWQVVVAVVEIIAGIVIVASPGIGVSTLAILVAISFILRGLALSAIGLFELAPHVASSGPVAAS